jgi:hypothetical protein
MEANKSSTAPGRRLLIAGIVLIAIGAGLMDQAGRSHEDLWWNISGAFAFLGFLVTVLSLLVTEGRQFWSRPPRP